MTNLENKQRLISLGGKEWNKHDKESVYITNEILNTLLDEKNLSPVNYGKRNNKIFLDVKTNIIMRNYKNKTSIKELDLN